MGHLQILRCPEAGHLPTPGTTSSFWHACGFLSEYNYTEVFYWKNKQIGSSVKDGKKLKRFIKACSRFYACISSLLIKPELHSEIGSYRRESTFSWFYYWIKFPLILLGAAGNDWCIRKTLLFSRCDKRQDFAWNRQQTEWNIAHKWSHSYLQKPAYGSMPLEPAETSWN